MRFLWLLPAWLLLVATMIAPQLVYFVTGRSFVLAVVAGVVPVLLIGLLFLQVAPTTNHALVNLGIIAVLALLSAMIGTEGYQRALALAGGRTLDGVTMDQALQRGQVGTWVRITDARVRSDAAHTVSMTRGDSRRPGSQTTTSITLAPVTLASAVPHEDPHMRNMYGAKLGGPVVLWACGSSSMVDQWDRDRQAVRGVMERIDDDVQTFLNKQLHPNAPAPVPGAGSIPAAPGAYTPAPPKIVERPLALAAQPWCVKLDWAVNAAKAREDAFATVLAFLLMMPLMLLGVFAIVVHGPEKKATS